MNRYFVYLSLMNDLVKYNDDQILISALKQRERDAFKYLYQHYTGTIKHFVKTNGGQNVDAEEIEQNVIIHLYEKIVNNNFVLNEGTKLSTYMFAVGKNMWYKKSSREIRHTPEDLIHGQLEEIDFYSSNYPNFLEMEVISALSKSDDDCKAILTMYYYDKKSMREIAENLGTITEENLRKRKYKCIQKLKKVLTDKIKNHG